MLDIIFLLIGCTVSAFGFASMRDPMRFALFCTFTPQLGTYYQRMALDRGYRIPLRMFGIAISFFGLAFFTVALQGLLKVKLLRLLPEAFLVLMVLTYASILILALVDAVVEGIRGRRAFIFDWYRMWKQSAELGPANVPIFDPRIDTEKALFTAAYSILVGLTLIIALLIATLS